MRVTLRMCLGCSHDNFRDNCTALGERVVREFATYPLGVYAFPLQSAEAIAHAAAFSAYVNNTL